VLLSFQNEEEMQIFSGELSNCVEPLQDFKKNTDLIRLSGAKDPGFTFGSWLHDCDF
jgi:hypothetical protein